ncbi:MAG: tRNA (guanosine(37)-N1)-methyltransferase TrmD [Endomicrobiales bacterium]
MKIDILTIFPAMFDGPLTESLISRAREKKILDIHIHDIRALTTDKHHCVDDKPFGGGPGMVMKPEPLYRALAAVGATRKKNRPYVIYLSPQGQRLGQTLATTLARHTHLVLVCGHYEGIDERVMRWIDAEVSIGDYVLTGGELPAMVLIDVIARLLPGVVKERLSVEQDSFYNKLLDYPHYTRPAVFKRMKVPPVLLSGDHARMDAWRKEQALERTRQRRPDLLETTARSHDKKQRRAQNNSLQE